MCSYRNPYQPETVAKDADSFDERSDDKGAEPEGLAMTEIDGRCGIAVYIQCLLLLLMVLLRLVFVAVAVVVLLLLVVLLFLL